MDNNFLVNLTSRAWSLPILAKLHEGVPARQAPLLHATGAGRSSFLNSLMALQEAGLLERNSGYGHPLRPEYCLTDKGIVAAAMASKVMGAVPQDDQSLMRTAWAVPIVANLGYPLPFGHIKRSLPRITDRALSQSLKRLENQDWVQRRVVAELRPPRAMYRASGVGQRIVQVLASTQ